MSFAGRIAGTRAAVGALSTRARTSTRTAFDFWRDNLPIDWWVSLACAASGLFALALLRVLLYGFV